MAYKTDSDKLQQYTRFVDTVTSPATKDLQYWKDSLDILEEQGIQPQRLMTAAVGMCAESGEFADICKKLSWHGKEFDEETRTHLKKEIGDVCWYLSQAIIALDTTWEEVLDMNIAKLSDRYPGGFDALRSASRKEGDI